MSNKNLDCVEVLVLQVCVCCMRSWHWKLRVPEQFEITVNLCRF
jgi:hypothetical protein